MVVYSVFLGMLPSRGSHLHKACRTICNQDQNEIKGSRCYFALNKTIKGCSEEAIKKHRRTVLSKTDIYKAFTRTSRDQGPF